MKKKTKNKTKTKKIFTTKTVYVDLSILEIYKIAT